MAQKRAGVIGWPVSHSLSPAMHNAAYHALGLTDWQYDALPIPPDILRQSLRELAQHGYVGLNVTVPFKTDVLRYFRPDDLAKAVGAANTLTLQRMQATNTDVAGLMDDLAAHHVEVSGQRVIVLGAGGAARAAVYGLHAAGARVVLVNRTPEHAWALLHDLNVFGEVQPHAQAAEDGAALVVNCTPLGLPHTGDATPWPDELPLPDGATVYDMVYRPAVTPLMRQAERSGLRAIGGLGMLVRQGAAAFQLWTGQTAPLDVMFDAAQAALAVQEVR